MIRKVFPILALCIFSTMLGIGIISPILPLYAENLGATGVWLGIISGGFSISRTLLVPVVGRLSDLKGRKKILTIGLFSYAVFSLGYIWAGNIAGLVVIRILHGVGACFVSPITQAYVGDIAPEGEEGRWMGYFNAALLAGFGCGPLMGGVLTEHLGTDAAFYAMGVLNLVAFLGVVFFLPEVTRRDRLNAPPPSFRSIASSRRTWGLFSMLTGLFVCRGVAITFLPILAAISLGLSASLIGILLTIQIIAGSVLQVSCGRIADRFNRRALVLLASISIIAGLMLIPRGGSFWALLGFSMLFSMGDAGALPAVSAMAVEEGKKYGMGMAMAMVNMATGVGLAIGPILAGMVTDLFNNDFAFYFAAAFVLLCAVIFRWFTSEKSEIVVPAE